MRFFVPALSCFLLIVVFALDFPAVQTSSEEIELAGPPELPTPEMPGDRYRQVLSWIDQDGGRFMQCNVIVEYEQVSPVDAITKVVAQAYIPGSRSKEIRVPELEFTKELRDAMADRKVSRSLDSAGRVSTVSQVGGLITQLCLSNGIAPLFISPHKLQFGLHKESGQPLSEIAGVKRANEAGLSLDVEFPEKVTDRWRISLKNKGSEPVKLGAVDKSIHYLSGNSFYSWSAVPVGDPLLTNHPSGVSAEEKMWTCGCSPPWASLWGETTVIDPGSSLDLSGQVSVPRRFEEGMGRESGRYKLVLFLRNDPDFKVNNPRWSGSESLIEKMSEGLRDTLDCLIISNEVEVEVIDGQIFREGTQSK